MHRRKTDRQLPGLGEEGQKVADNSVGFLWGMIISWGCTGLMTAHLCKEPQKSLNCTQKAGALYGVCYVTVNPLIRWSHSKSKQHNCSILEHWHFRKYTFPTITVLHPAFRRHKAGRDGHMLAVEASSRGDIRKGTCPGQGVCASAVKRFT